LEIIVVRQNNHPKKGDRIAVEPIRKLKDIKAIANYLETNPRDRLLFLMGINNGLRACDLVRLRVGQVAGLKSGGSIKIKESKTGKENVLVVNKSVHKALRAYLEAVRPRDQDYLFPSRKGGNLQSQAVQKLVKKWTSTFNLKGNFGAHTLRKTFGYIQRVHFGVGFEILCKRYNHSNPSITMRYLGIEDKEVHNILMNEIG
jgi:integrase